MDVVLPATGCNIINSNTTFYNYSPDSRTRSSYVIYDGKAILQSTSTNQYGYTYTGDCLVTGDLTYKPELEVYLPVISFILICAAILLAYKIVLWRFIK